AEVRAGCRAGNGARRRNRTRTRRLGEFWTERLALDGANADENGCARGVRVDTDARAGGWCAARAGAEADGRLGARRSESRWISRGVGEDGERRARRERGRAEVSDRTGTAPGDGTGDRDAWRPSLALGRPDGAATRSRAGAQSDRQ